MTVSPADLLGYAEHQISSTDETCIRAGVSRAFYAILHTGEEIVVHCPTITPNAGDGSHKTLIRRFTQVPRKGFPGAAKAREIGALLGQARVLRVKADYHISEDCRILDLKQQICAVERAIKLANEFSAIHSKSSISA